MIAVSVKHTYSSDVNGRREYVYVCMSCSLVEKVSRLENMYIKNIWELKIIQKDK